MIRVTICGILAVTCFLAPGCEPQQKSGSTATSRDGAPSELKGVMPEGAIEATTETIQNGTYRPLSRPLFLYVNKAALKKPEAAAFLRYYFSDEGSSLIPETGFIELKKEQFIEQRNKLEAAIKEANPPEVKELRGELIIDGSSTVAPVSIAMAEEFSRKNASVRVPVGTSGTGGGFKKFCHGEISICDASRHISASEIELCKKAGIEYLELEICMDGITIVVNPEADWIAGITVADLKKIWNPDSTVKLWSDINPDFPNAPIKLFGPDTDSGTFEYFTEEICGKKGASRSDYQQSGDDNFLVTGVAGDKHSFAYFGYAYYLENKHKLKALLVAP